MRLLPPDWQEKYGYCVLGEMEEVKLYCHAIESAGQAGRDRAGGAGPLSHRLLGRAQGGTGTAQGGDGQQGLCIEPCSHLPQLSGIANLICNDAAVGMLNGDFVDHIGIIHGCRLKQELSSVFLSGGPIQLISGMEKILGAV